MQDLWVTKKTLFMNTTQRTTLTSRILLMCGAIAGPLFVVTFFLEQAIQPGYSPLRPLNFIIWVMATVCSAALSWRSPPRESRCRVLSALAI
jgi:hypothetical protein